MLFQYLTGLFALKHGDGVDFTVVLGDLVFDQASGTKRDVDVTVSTPDGDVYAFVGYEVKHWTAKLDVSDVEALAAKLKDMPDVTHRAIVCSSGYTGPAIKKAEYHGVDLYVIKEWTTPVEETFPDLAPMKGAPSDVFKGAQYYLTWNDWSTFLHADGPLIELSSDTPLFGADGNLHSTYPDFNTFADSMAVCSTETLQRLKTTRDRLGPQVESLLLGETAARQDDPMWPYAHTFEVGTTGVHIRETDGQLRHVDAVTIDGKLSWNYSPMLYLAMENVPTGDMFASALVGVSPVPGRMLAIMIPTSGRTLSIRKIELSRDQRNAIRRLEVPTPGDVPPGE
jgi:hypothetical protein